VDSRDACSSKRWWVITRSEPETHGFVVMNSMTSLPPQGSIPNALSIPPSSCSEIRSLSPCPLEHAPSPDHPRPRQRPPRISHLKGKSCTPHPPPSSFTPKPTCSPARVTFEDGSQIDFRILATGCQVNFPSSESKFYLPQCPPASQIGSRHTNTQSSPLPAISSHSHPQTQLLPLPSPTLGPASAPIQTQHRQLPACTNSCIYRSYRTLSRCKRAP